MRLTAFRHVTQRNERWEKMRQITYRCIFSCMMHSYLVWGGAPKMGRGEKHCMEVVVAQRELELVLLKIHTFNDGGFLVRPIIGWGVVTNVTGKQPWVTQLVEAWKVQFLKSRILDPI